MNKLRTRTIQPRRKYRRNLLVGLLALTTMFVSSAIGTTTAHANTGSWGSFPSYWPGRTGVYLPPPSDQLPDGQWHVIANGRLFPMEIENGQMISGPSGEITQFQYEVEQGSSGKNYKVSFRRTIGALVQDWVGYLMFTDSDQQGEPLDDQYRIAGTFGKVNHPTGTAHTGGWYATLTRPQN